MFQRNRLPFSEVRTESMDALSSMQLAADSHRSDQHDTLIFEDGLNVRGTDVCPPTSEGL